ncbi:MAG: hypothetical protein AAFY48_24710, partial [Bacteroidota bacterium]
RSSRAFTSPLKRGITGVRSYVELLPGVNFTGTDSLMPPTVFRLATPKTVTAGFSYLLEGRFKYGTSLDEAVMQLVE